MWSCELTIYLVVKKEKLKGIVFHPKEKKHSLYSCCTHKCRFAGNMPDADSILMHRYNDCSLDIQLRDSMKVKECFDSWHLFTISNELVIGLLAVFVGQQTIYKVLCKQIFTCKDFILILPKLIDLAGMPTK